MPQRRLSLNRREPTFHLAEGRTFAPRRNFAFAEILGTVVALTHGFDIRAEDGRLMRVPEMQRARLVEAVDRPSKKGVLISARITRRKGWENVRWKFVTGKE